MAWKPLPRPQDECGPQPVADSLATLARRLGFPTPDVVAGLFNHWEELVGASLAAHVRPVHVDGHTLVLETAEPAWATQIRFLGADIVAKIAERLPDASIEVVKVRIVREGSGTVRPSW